MVHTAKQSKKSDESFGLNPDLVFFLSEALDQYDSARVKDHVKNMHVADITEFINQASPEHRIAFVNIIKSKFDPEVLIDLEPQIKDEVIELLGAKKSAQAIAQLDSDDAVQVVEDLEKPEQRKIIKAIEDKEQRAELRQGLAYPEDSAGRIMNTSFVSIPRSWNVGQTIDFLRNEDNQLPTDFYQIFVTDRQNKPIGAVLVSRVLRNKRNIKISGIMEKNIRTINATIDQEDVAYMFNKYALASAPVVDGKGKMVGEISVDDVVNVIDEEAEEDIMRLGGVKETDLHASFFNTANSRFPWLFVNLLTAIAASAVIAYFEDTIQQLVALAVLMPIVASMAGNAGTQTLTIAVRGLATKDLTSTNARRVIYKEVVAAMFNGLFFATIVGAISYLYYFNTELSIVFAGATLCSLTIAGLAGALIPLFLARSGVDPAIASGIFLTTVTDVSAFFIFLGLAAWWM